MVDATKFYYDKFLFDQAGSLNQLVFNNNDKETQGETKPADEKVVLALIKYAIEYYLEWTPAYAMESLDDGVLKKLGLYQFTMTRIRYPVELSNPDSPRGYYIVCKLYPEIYKYDKKAAVIHYYNKNVLIGNKYTNNIFDPDNEEGKERAGICLLYAISEENWLHAMDIKDLYGFFGGTKVPGAKMSLNEFISHYHFKSIIDKGYAKSALDFLHAALPKNERSTLWYTKNRFMTGRKKA